MAAQNQLDAHNLALNNILSECFLKASTISFAGPGNMQDFLNAALGQTLPIISKHYNTVEYSVSDEEDGSGAFTPFLKIASKTFSCTVTVLNSFNFSELPITSKAGSNIGAIVAIDTTIDNTSHSFDSFISQLKYIHNIVASFNFKKSPGSNFLQNFFYYLISSLENTQQNWKQLTQQNLPVLKYFTTNKQLIITTPVNPTQQTFDIIKVVSPVSTLMGWSQQRCMMVDEGVVQYLSVHANIEKAPDQNWKIQYILPKGLNIDFPASDMLCVQTKCASIFEELLRQYCVA